MGFSEIMQTIKKILCATDLSDASGHVLSLSAGLCLRFDASITIYHAILPPRDSVARQIEFERGGEKEEKVRHAHEEIKELMARFDVKWDSVVTYGDPVLEVARVEKIMEIDLVIAASYGLSGLQRFLIGSIIERMAQTISKPLLVIPSGKTGSNSIDSDPIGSDPIALGLPISNIMVACSLSASDADLKGYALAFSEKFNTTICLAHVMESPVNEEIVEITSVPYEQAQKILEEKLSLRLKTLIDTKTHIMHGIPGEELVLYVKKHGIDMIITGVEDRPGRIMTTTTAALLRHAPCAVLTVPIRSG